MPKPTAQASLLKLLKLAKRLDREAETWENLEEEEWDSAHTDTLMGYAAQRGHCEGQAQGIRMALEKMGYTLQDSTTRSR